MSDRILRFLLLTLGALCLASSCLAQTTGAIVGTVSDADGKNLAGVTVEVTSPNLQGSRTTVTSGEGRYRIAGLPPGLYKVTAKLEGLGSTEKSTPLSLDSTATLNLQLSLTAQAAVTVSGQAPLVDTTSTTGGTSYTSAVIDKLPLGRNYAEIIKSNPGVNTDQGDTQGRALSLTVYGATSVENQFIIDGINTTNVIRGFQGKAINGEFIQEVEIKTGGYPAEYGRALGGVVNVITKSGGNDFHGDGFVYYDSFGMRSDQVINQNDIFQGMRVNGYNRTDFGLDIGGPIMKDKLWFFGAYDRVAKPTQISRFNDSVDENGVVTVNRNDKFPANSTDNLYSGKLTWNIATGTTLVGTIFADPSTVVGAGASDPTHSYYPVPIVNRDPATWQSDLSIGGTDYGLRLNQLLGSTGLVTVQGSRHYDRYQTVPAGAGTGVRFEDWTCVGGTPDSPCSQPVSANSAAGGFGGVSGYIRNNFSTRYQARGDTSLSLGDHEIKVGGDWQDGKTTAITNISGKQTVTRYNEYGQTYYAHAFWAAGPSDFTPVDNVVSPHTINMSAFAQDSWKVLPGLTVNAGVRWDHENLKSFSGESVITLTNEWQPRVGIVWDPFNNGSMKVYAFGGRFYYALPTDLNVRSYGQQLFVTTYNLNSGGTAADIAQDPNVIGHGAAHTQGGIFAEPHDASLKGIYQDEFNFGVEKLIDPTFSIGVKVEYRRFGNAVEDRCDADPAAPENNGNTCVITNPGGSGLYASGSFTGCNGLDGDAYACGISPINSLLGGTAPQAKRLYRGIELVARKTFKDSLWLQASYVYSSLRGNYDGEVKQDYVQTDPGITADFDYASFLKNKYGILYLDRPHNFRLDMTYSTPWKLAIGFQGYVQSGPPLSKIGYFNQFYIAQTQLVPLGSAGRLPAQYEANLSLSYPMKVGPTTVTLTGYIFNLLNRQAITNVDNNWQISQPINYPKTPDQYNQLFYAPCTVAQSSDPVANKCNEQNNANYGKATSRQDPRLFRASVKVSF